MKYYVWLAIAFITACEPIPASKPPPQTPVYSFGLVACGVPVASTTTPCPKPVAGATIQINNGASGYVSAIADANGYVLGVSILPFSDIKIGAAGFADFAIGIEPPKIDHQNLTFSLTPIAPPVTRRTGVVRASGRAVVDDGGLFHPLGLTFMWGLYGEKFERDRVAAHLRWLAPYKFDYLRILAEVSWAGEAIDPAWDDYELQLGQLIDDAYKIAGLRTEITLTGGGPYDKMALAAKVARVINAGRQEKVIAVECANESSRNGPSLAVLVQMATYLRATIPNLVALSSPGDWAAMKAATNQAGATLVTIHTDRGGGDRKWRQVRQGWDFKDFSQVVDSNEPPGPESSVDTNDNPLQLAMMRATGILSGGAMYVLHVGDMVAGRIDPAHHRTANLWDVPNIDAILRAVRGVDALLPDNIENWQKFNNNWAGHPLTADAFWGDGADHGVYCNYAACDATQCAIVEDGVKNRVVNTAHRAMHVKAFDPLTGGVLFEADLAAGQTWELPGTPDTMTAYIVQGTFR